MMITAQPIKVLSGTMHCELLPEHACKFLVSMDRQGGLHLCGSPRRVSVQVKEGRDPTDLFDRLNDEKSLGAHREINVPEDHLILGGSHFYVASSNHNGAPRILVGGNSMFGVLDRSAIRICIASSVRDALIEWGRGPSDQGQPIPKDLLRKAQAFLAGK